MVETPAAAHTAQRPDVLRKLAQGRTAILITHRFTTARIADRIALMVDGRVIEYGTHEELLERGGRYAAGWNSQTQREAVPTAGV